MARNALRSLIFVASVACLGAPALADDAPTLHQVYQAAEAGRLDEAQAMMGKVIQAHPDSAKAHFVDAEILAKQGRLGNAETELNKAKRLSPGLPFAKPQAVTALEARIATTRPGGQWMGSGAREPSGGGFPWGMVLMGLAGIGLVIFLFRAMSSRNSTFQSPSYSPGVPGAAAQPYPGGTVAPMSPMGGGIGSSIASGLATGVAVGAGVVAGEALAHHFLDGNQSNTNTVSPVADSWGTSSDDMGGADFGIADNSSWDDSANFSDGMSDAGGGDWT